jgi:hypothetical protein
MPGISKNRDEESLKRRRAQKKALQAAFMKEHPDSEPLTENDLSTILNAVSQEEKREGEFALEIMYRSADAPHKRPIQSWPAHFRTAVLISSGKAPRPQKPKWHPKGRASRQETQYPQYEEFEEKATTPEPPSEAERELEERWKEIDRRRKREGLAF